MCRHLNRSVSFLESIEKIILFDLTPKLSCFCFTWIIVYVMCRKGFPKIKGTLLSSSISRITKSIKKVNFPTSTSIFFAIPISIFSTIPTRYYNDRSASRTLILVGLRALRDNFAYREYGMRLILALRSDKALQEKVLLKVHRMRKLPGSPNFTTVSGIVLPDLESGKDTISCPHRLIIGVSHRIVKLNELNKESVFRDIVDKHSFYVCFTNDRDVKENFKLFIPLEGSDVVVEEHPPLSLMPKAGRSGSAVVGEELNTSSTLFVPLNVIPLIIVYHILDDDKHEEVVVVDVAFRSMPGKKRKKEKAKKLVDDAFVAEGSRAGDPLGLGDQDAQIMFPSAHGGRTLLPLIMLLQISRMSILILGTLKENEVEAAHLHNEEVTCLKSRIAELEAEVIHVNDDPVVTGKSASLDHDQAGFYKAEKEKLRSIMSLRVHLLSGEIRDEVPYVPQLMLKLIRQECLKSGYDCRDDGSTEGTKETHGMVHDGNCLSSRLKSPKNGHEAFETRSIMRMSAGILVKWPLEDSSSLRHLALSFFPLMNSRPDQLLITEAWDLHGFIVETFSEVFKGFVGALP
uniref:Uncharacterized protein n=1 Tax=Tanacetum cinerariifolium TaxID=118510 RepID=A0A6L2M9B6_TANCI|nr:hypothetical protein [Tanacetum cinerariifolium]